MKRIWSVMTAGLMAATGIAACAAFAGCSDTGYSKEGRLAVWVGEQLEDLFVQIGKDYEAETGIPVVIKTYTGLTASDKLALDGPFGKGGDIYMQGGGGDLAKAVEQGLFMEVSKEDMELETKFITGAQELMQYQGKLYGVPLGTEVNVLYYNKDILAEFPEDWTWEDMIDYALSYNNFGDGVKTKDEKFGLLIDYSNPYYTWAINEAFGGYIFGKDEDGNYVPTDLGIDNDGSIAAMHYIKDMIDNKVIPENMNSSVCQSKFMSGKAAIMLDGSWSLANFRNAGIDVGVAKLPDIQISETETGTPRVFAGGYGLAISAFTVNPEESKDFLKFATKDEYVFEYYKVTGRVPSTVGCSTDEEVLADDCLVGFYAQAEDSYPQPPINELNAVWDPLTAASVAIFTNNEDIATVMHKIKQDILANIELLG